MYYIERQNDELVKYEVKIDTTELKKIRHKIISECGEITHRSYDDTKYPNIHDYTHIRNYRQKKIGRTDPKDFFSSAEDIYHFEYDEYKDTKLVTLINRLLNGETSVITELKNPTSEVKDDKKKVLLSKIKEVQEALQMASNSIIMKEKIKILESYLKQLKELEENQLLNQNRKSDLEYYPQVLEYIILMEVSRMPLNRLEQFNSLFEELEIFFTDAKEKNINPKINKELYKRITNN